MRGAIADHLYAIRRYAAADCVYVNTLVRNLPTWLVRSDFDLIVFHTTLLSMRWGRDRFPDLIERLRPLASNRATRIALPQDEFINTDLLCDFVNALDVRYVFSVAPESTWGQIYAGIDRERVRLHKVLTGYVDARRIERIRHLASAISSRPIDVGYRAYGIRHALGRHGYLKIEIAERARPLLAERGLSADISTRFEDTLYGDDWTRFLLRSRYTLGVEGGASLFDPDGSIHAKVREYMSAHPTASFEAVEAACFPGRDGTFDLMAISPRHLEACATRTVQILVEGEYSGVLQPDVHYIPVCKDLSNLEEVLCELGDEERRSRIAERAYADVVSSGRYSYETFVERLLACAHPATRDPALSPGALRLGPVRSAWLSLVEWFSWTRPLLRGVVATTLYAMERRFPRLAVLRRRLRRTT